MLVGNNARRVAIIGGARIPFARSMGAYAECSNQQMLTAALQALVDKFSLAGERLGDVGAGAVLKSPRDFNLTRECVLGTTLDPHTPAFDLQRACGTSLETAILLGAQDRRGPDRLRHCRRRRHRQRRADRHQRKPAADHAAQRARPQLRRAAEALARPAARRTSSPISRRSSSRARA